jgi:hypothetical protein
VARRAPAEGERTALRGYAAQLKVGAARILQAFEEGVLEAVAVADPEAGRVDDLQMLTVGPGGVQVDAFQVKWSGESAALADVELRGLIVDALAGRALLQAAWATRRAAGEEPVSRFVVHIHTNRPLSTAALRGEGIRGQGLTLPRFVREVWRRAQHLGSGALDDLSGDWQAYLAQLAEEADLDVRELLDRSRDVRLEYDRALPEDATFTDWRGQQFLRDVRAFASGLLDAVTDERKLVVLSAAAFLDVVGPEWAERWRPRSSHAFPVPPDYQPIAESRQALEVALAEFDQGYVFVTGSPGSGKSTMLTRELRSDPRVVARYYAFVPEADTATRGEAHALIHDLLLALDRRERRRTLAPPQAQIPLLLERLRAKLAELGTEATAKGTSAVILIDGLDHVLRDPKPQTPLLETLLPADEVPQGVLFVLGTRNVTDLPSRLQPEARLQGRHIHMAPMDRRATRKLAELAGMDYAVQERVWELSEGHPLLSRTFVARAKGAAAGAQLEALAAIPQPDGEATRYYETVWGDLQEDDDLVAVLGLVCRLRGPIDLNWLEASAVSAGSLERLGRLEHLFRTSGAGRWTFFHDSFREFLRGRTAYRLGVYDAGKERAIHKRLADLCEQTAPDQPQAWEELHHRLRAGDMAGVIGRATPDYFREQILALRPPGEVATDIMEAAAALATQHDAVAAVRLALAAAECRLRDYHAVINGDFLLLLVALGEPDAAIAHVHHIRDTTAGNDQTCTALEFSIVLHNQQLEDDATRLFIEFEPIGLLDNRADDRRDVAGQSGPWKTLYTWARAAVVIHGTDYVIEQTAQLELNSSDLAPDEDAEEATAVVKANMLNAAVGEMAQRGRAEDAEALIAALPAGDAGRSARAHILIHRATEAFATATPEAAGEILDELLADGVDPIDRATVIRLGELFVQLARADDARALVDRLPSLTVPEYTTTNGDEDTWRLLLRQVRLQATVGGSLDPTDVFPGGDPQRLEWWRIVVARHHVSLANLWARHLRGEPVGTSEIIGSVRAILGLWDNRTGRDRHDLWSALSGRTVFMEGAIALAGERGEEAVDALWQWWTPRWLQPGYALSGGLGVVEHFADAGVGPVSIRARLRDFGASMASDADVSDRIELALAWVDADDLDHSRAVLDSAMSATFAVGFRKDYQLSTWIELLGPLLRAPGGSSLAGWLAERIVELGARAEVGAAHDAAEHLVRIAGLARPGEVLKLARRLMSEEVFDVDDVVESALMVTAGAASARWWIVLGEILVSLGTGPIDLGPAGATPRDRAELARHLRFVAERAATEGRPSERSAWYAAIVEAAKPNGITLSQLGLTDADLQVRPEASRDDDGDDVGALSLDELLTHIAGGERGHDVVRSAVRRIPDMDEDQRAKLLTLVGDSEQSTAVLASLAGAAEASGRIDRAWSWAAQALAHGSGTDWRRNYAGGPVLKAIRILRRIDASRARPMVFERFATVAQEDHWLLSAIAEDLDEMIDVLAPFDESAIAREVLAYVVELSGATEPDLDDADDGSDSGTSGDDDPLVGVVAWLLGSLRLLGWSAAQRASLEILRSRGETASALLAMVLAEDAGIEPDHILTLLTVAFDEELVDPDDVAAWLTRAAENPRLNIRAAAGALLRRVGRPVPVPAARDLPAGLRLNISRAPEPLQGASAIGAGDVDEMLGYGEEQLERLADAADVDAGALSEYIRAKASRIAARMPSDEDMARDRSVLGWGFVRPSALAVDQATAETAAELVDAGRVSAALAEANIRSLPRQESELLRLRPAPRPGCVAPAATADERKAYFNNWINEPGDPETRIATSEDGWAVIAELTELAILDRRNPREERRQALIGPSADNGLFQLQRVSVDAAHDDVGAPAHRLIARTILRGLAFGDGYVALHPGAARAAGLEPDPDDPLAWCLDDEVVVRSIWWRSGYASWLHWSGGDEVGDGWLVVARPAGVRALLDAYPGGTVRWLVVREARDEEDHGDMAPSVVGGERELSTAEDGGPDAGVA